MRRFFSIAAMLFLVGIFHAEGQSARQCYRAAQDFIDKGNYQDALTQLSRAVEIDPKFIDAYVRRAAVLEKTGQLQAALYDYNRALVFDPKEEDFYFEAGRLSYLLQKYDDALRFLDKTLEIRRGYLEAYQYKIRTLIALERYNDAATVCETALMFKENEIHLYLAGVINENLKKYDEAERDYVRAVNKNRNFAEALLALANLRIQLNKPDQAIESANALLAIDPNNIQAYILRSKALVLKLDYPGAINDLSKAILIKPNDQELFFLRGTYFQAFTQFQSAINDFSKCLMLNDKDAEAYYRRASCYEEIADFKAAIKDYTSLTRLSDTDVKAKKLLAEAKSRLYELNRETDPPQISLNEPEPGNKAVIMIPRGKSIVTMKGRVSDQSDIKYIRINDRNVAFVKNDGGYTFIDEVNTGNCDSVVILASDVYNNVQRMVYRIARTETDPPVISLKAPYSSDNNVIYLDTYNPDLSVQGTITDESGIRSILIDSVAASYKVDDHNPEFSATIRIANRDKFSVTATDIYGNKAEKIYLINRSGADIMADNRMGKTWVIFIENSNYRTFASLEGPTKDVVLMKSALANYKINNIIHKKDMSKKDMEKFFSIELRDLIKSNQVKALLIWYAGHGKFINETGYWIPVDANRDDEFSYYNINNLRAALQSYSDELKHTLVVTDACESGPTFYQAMRNDPKPRSCEADNDILMKSSQVFSSAGYELAVDNSQFTKTFASVLASNSDACLPIEKIVKRVTTAVVQNNQQKPRFGKIAGLGDEDGTFFFMSKK